MKIKLLTMQALILLFATNLGAMCNQYLTPNYKPKKDLKPKNAIYIIPPREQSEMGKINKQPNPKLKPCSKEI